MGTLSEGRVSGFLSDFSARQIVIESSLPQILCSSFDSRDYLRQKRDALDHKNSHPKLYVQIRLLISSRERPSRVADLPLFHPRGGHTNHLSVVLSTPASQSRYTLPLSRAYIHNIEVFILYLVSRRFRLFEETNTISPTRATLVTVIICHD